MIVSSLEIGNRSTAEAIAAGEIPLNGCAKPLTGKAEGEDIVSTSIEI